MSYPVCKRYFTGKTCVVCYDTYNVANKPKKRTRGLGVRPRHCITCSRKCSRVYVKLTLEEQRKLKNKLKRKLKNEVTN